MVIAKAEVFSPWQLASPLGLYMQLGNSNGGRGESRGEGVSDTKKDREPARKAQGETH